MIFGFLRCLRRDFPPTKRPELSLDEVKTGLSICGAELEGLKLTLRQSSAISSDEL